MPEFLPACNPGVPGGPLRNFSGIGANTSKFQDIPSGWNESAVSHGSERFTQDMAGHITKVFQGPWSCRHAFREWALGYNYSVIDPDTQRPIIHRTPPVQHSELYWLYATGVEFHGQGAVSYLDTPLRDQYGEDLGVTVPVLGYYHNRGINSGVDHETCLATVTYDDLPYEVKGDTIVADPLRKGELERFVTREMSFNARSLTVDKGQVTFTEGPHVGRDLASNGLQLIFPTVALKYTWWHVPELPFSAIITTIGKVNDRNFDGAGNGAWPTWPAETLLCLAPEVTRHRNHTGQILYRIVYHFLYQPNGWNRFPDACGSFWSARFKDNCGTNDGTANGLFSGDIAGVLRGVLGDLIGEFPNVNEFASEIYLLGTFLGQVTGEDYDGFFDGEIVTGALTQQNRLISGRFNGTIRGRLRRERSRVYRTTNFARLFQPGTPTTPDS